jgi:hypothetical protein
VTDTGPAVLLALFRDRAEDLTDHDDGRCADPQKSCTGHDALRMADALDAVLKLADEAQPVERDYGGEPIWWDLTPEEVREAITRGLSGEAGDGN